MRTALLLATCVITVALEFAGPSAQAQTVDRVVINATTRDPVQTLITALTAENREVDGVGKIPIVVELCDVDLDMTGQSLEIGDARSLIASPGCARGPRDLGPRLFVTASPPDGALFILRGDNIRVAGFRLQGPTDGIGGGSGHLENAIKIWPYASPDPIRSIDVSDMEIFHWSGAAVALRDNTEEAERGRLFNTNEGAVRIHDNFIHDNRHDAGFGYGVVVGGGAYALIERNVFDENRHAIAGDSSDGKKDFSGYSLRDNLILSGGGLHCSANWAFVCWDTHQIDMHGDQNAWYSSSNWCCGTAGETMLIERNTILYTAGPAIKIRGNPADKAVVDGNVFSDSRGDAIKQNGAGGYGDNITNPIDVRPNNTFGADPLAQQGRCDFVGDGRQDAFVATGVTWWARSPLTAQWRYLNTMPERLSEIQLEDVNGDGRCDVVKRPPSPELAPRTWSENGTGPWKPIQILDPN